MKLNGRAKSYDKLKHAKKYFLLTGCYKGTSTTKLANFEYNRHDS